MGLAQEPMKKMNRISTKATAIAGIAAVMLAGGAFYGATAGSAASSPSSSVSNAPAFSAAPGVCASAKDAETSNCRNFAPGRAASSADKAISSDQAIAFARTVAGSRGKTPVAPQSAPASAVEMTYQQMLDVTKSGADPAIDPRRNVLVATVHAPAQAKAPYGGEGKTYDVYSVVFDAATGTPFVKAFGADIVGMYNKAMAG
jgi:hypothetical protein